MTCSAGVQFRRAKPIGGLGIARSMWCCYRQALWFGLFTVGRTEVARPCRSYANRLLAKYTHRILNSRDLRPKFRHVNGLLDTAYERRE